MANGLVKHVTTSSTTYKALSTPDTNTIYILEDVGRIAKGSTILSDIIKYVDVLPVSGDDKNIYILPALDGYIYKNSAWTKIFTAVSHISTSYTLVFNIISTLTTGITPILEKAISSGTISSINVVATTAGTTDTVIDIEKISESDLESGGSYTSIFTSGNQVKIPATKYSNKSASTYILNGTTSAITKGDILRLNVLSDGTGVAGVSLQITIDL